MQYKYINYIMYINLDSNDETQDNGGSTTPPEDVGGPLETPLMAGKGIVIEVDSGHHELAGADQSVTSIDYMEYQGQLAGKPSNTSTYTQSDTLETKSHILAITGSSFTVNGAVTANLVCIYK